MYERERSRAIDLVTEACILGRRVQADIVAAGDVVTKQDRSPVTLADLAIQAVVSHRLVESFPNDSLLAEEEAKTLTSEPGLAERVLHLVRQCLPGLSMDGLVAALEREATERGSRRWVLDPIDGTKGFLRGDQYAVALALVVQGEVVVGALGCPNLARDTAAEAPGRGWVFAAERGRGSSTRSLERGSDSPVRVDEIADPGRAVFCESVESAHAAHSDQAEIARRLGITRPSVRIDSQCKYAMVARGDASIYLRLARKKDYREKVWDHAAGSVIIEEAGGRVTDLDGEPLDFSEGRYLARHHGIVASNGHLHDRVLEACREVLNL
jgi:3'(2'), 5'-bisphosphate nucleotidase